MKKFVFFLLALLTLTFPFSFTSCEGKKPPIEDTIKGGIDPNTVLTLNPTQVSITPGEQKRISIALNPQPSGAFNIAWTSSNPAVATVVNGIVNGVSAGVSTVTASTPDGLISASCVVTVEPLVDTLTSFSISKSSVSLYVGKTTTLKATYEPADAGVSVVWTSSDPSVATVTDGVVKAIGYGKASITATSAANSAAKAVCEVSVFEHCTGIELSATSAKPALAN